MSKLKSRANFVQLFRRVIEYVKSDDILTNGNDNLYPNRMRDIINESSTASLAVRALSDFISGMGVDEDVIVNRLGQKISEINNEIADSIAYQNEFYVHFDYSLDENMNLIPSNPVVLPYEDCRKSKPDDLNNDGLIYVADWENRSDFNSFFNKIKDNKKKSFYPFNSSQEIVKSQIKKDAGEVDNIKDALLKYRGQVLHVNLTPKYEYAMSLFHPVYNDADTENRMSIYTNGIWRAGFLGKILAITSGLDEDAEETISKWMGAEGAQGMAYISLETATDIKDAIHIEKIESQFDEDQYKDTREAIRDNILGCAKNLPKELVLGSSGLFSQSGTSIRELKLFYSEQTQKERSVIESFWKKTMNLDVKIKPIITEDEILDN